MAIEFFINVVHNLNVNAVRDKSIEHVLDIELTVTVFTEFIQSRGERLACTMASESEIT